MVVHPSEERKPDFHRPRAVCLEQANRVGDRHAGRYYGEQVDVVLVGIHLEELDVGVHLRDIKQHGLKILGHSGLNQNLPAVFGHENEMVSCEIGCMRLVEEFHAAIPYQERGQEAKGRPRNARAYARGI